MKNNILLLLVAVTLSSCTNNVNPLQSVFNTLNKGISSSNTALNSLTASSVKPSQIKLNSSKVNYSSIALKWNGATPSAKIDGKWLTGDKQSLNTYSFGEDKFYNLTLNFTSKTFIESGFDGVWLPEIKGSWSIVK